MCFPLNPANLVPQRNTGDAVLNFTTRTLAGLNPTQFTVLPASTCTVGAAIAAGSSCTLDIQFNPTQSAGVRAATLTLTGNAIPTTQTITLSGSNFTAAPPTVSLTSPTANTNLTAPGSFTLTANANTPSSSVTQVDYYANGTMIGSATTAPYSYNWNTVPTGLYSLTALVTDGLGRHAISPSVIVAVTSGATTSTQAYYIHADHLDTPRVITDTAGNKVWQWDNTDPFGNNVPNENPSGLGTFVNNLGFPGQYRDKETNTYQNYFRDYDPATGRYIQFDPIGLAGGVNGFIYATRVRRTP
jgi:RHS repeat-associated protein